MARIWHQSNEPGAWASIPVPEAYRYVVTVFFNGRNTPGIQVRQRLRTPRTMEPDTDRLLLVRIGTVPAEKWFALTYPGVGLSINGEPVSSGITLLADRDLISFPPRSDLWAFSTERPAGMEPFDGPAGLFCPRCKLPVEAGQVVVACPVCGTVHHQDEDRELPCWTYAERCSQCDRSTDLTGSPEWTPDAL